MNTDTKLIDYVKESKSQHAFTLAEVLITLGIIGVVAALTIPTLINTYNAKVRETQIKKHI